MRSTFHRSDHATTAKMAYLLTFNLFGGATRAAHIKGAGVGATSLKENPEIGEVA